MQVAAKAGNEKPFTPSRVERRSKLYALEGAFVQSSVLLDYHV